MLSIFKNPRASKNSKYFEFYHHDWWYQQTNIVSTRLTTKIFACDVICNIYQSQCTFKTRFFSWTDQRSFVVNCFGTLWSIIIRNIKYLQCHWRNWRPCLVTFLTILQPKLHHINTDLLIIGTSPCIRYRLAISGNGGKKSTSAVYEFWPSQTNGSSLSNPLLPKVLTISHQQIIRIFLVFPKTNTPSRDIVNL